MAREWTHRLLRSLLWMYPARIGCAWLNRQLGRWLSADESHWLAAPGRGMWPSMVLDVANDLQRKLFYFPRIYGRFYGKSPFATFLATNLGAGARFLDIGANVGFFSMMAARLVGPSGRVFAFEPEPRMHGALVRSTRANGLDQVEAYPLALSDRDGELPFYYAHDGTASSLVAEAPGKESRYASMRVARVASLDSLLANGELSLPAVDLVKVDVEGEEARTLRGMRGYLAETGSPQIWCEVRGPEGSTRAPSTFRDVVHELVPLGYRPYLYARDGFTPITVADVRLRADVVFRR